VNYLGKLVLVNGFNINTRCSCWTAVASIAVLVWKAK